MSVDTHGSGLDLSNEPIAWVLIPLVIFGCIGVAATFFTIRRRRRLRVQYRNWPADRQRALDSNGNTIIQRQPRATQSRWAWANTRSQEGLNELGEAPPPYLGPKDGEGDGTELRDLEAGARPPAYPAEPGPAVMTDHPR